MLNLRFHSKFIFRTPVNPSNKNIDDNLFKEALYLSSPTLYNENQKVINGNSISEKEFVKLNISLYKYQSRASNRCTPFGLFAGISTGSWGIENSILLNSDLTKSIVRKTRLDMNVLCTLAQELSKQNFIKPHLKYYPNTSIYLIGNSYRYVEYYYFNTRRIHKITQVDFSCYLEKILLKSKDGLMIEELINIITQEDITREDASEFINELVSAQIIINQLEPTVTGTDYFDVLLFNLKEIKLKESDKRLSNIIEILIEIGCLIKNLDEAKFNSIDSYRIIHQKLKLILNELSETNLFQTDLYKIGVKSSLDTKIQEQLNDVVVFLNKISPLKINKKLEEFKQKFQENYEDCEIPLLLALDSETGIGYPHKDKNGVNDLIDDIYKIEINNDIEIKWGLLQSKLFQLIINSIKQNKKTITVTNDDFENIDYSNGTLPLSFIIMFNLLNGETNKINLKHIGGGSSAIDSLGRFASGDNNIEKIVNEIAEFEQKQLPDTILAEIVHLPDSRTGNIIARTSFRPYEIPYLAKSSVSDEFQINPADLTIKIRENRIILFDKRLKKEIIPRLGNAHSHVYNSLPIYHFLCDMQSQYVTKRYIDFRWGEISNQFLFLPRVEYKNVILSPAKWQLKKEDLDLLKNANHSEKEKIFSDLKSRIELPDKFIIADDDHELVIDCKKKEAIKVFFDVIKNKNKITLEEFLFEEENSVIKDTSGYSYTNECLAIVYNENKTTFYDTNHALYPVEKIKNKRVFSIGSEWIYYKIYCGIKTSDIILSENIRKISEKLLENGIIDKWFFIRYADPDMHIRVRFHVVNLNKYFELLSIVNEEIEPLINQFIVSKLLTDTYKREHERYGDNSIELAEQLFYNDSVFITEMLNLLDSESGGKIRWLIALRSVDMFLNDFKLDIYEKQKLMSSLSISFFNEHGGGKDLKLILDNKFRKYRDEIVGILNNVNDEQKECYPIIELINNRSILNELAITPILLLHSKNELQVNLNNLLASFIHMNLNRLFIGRNRTNEFVVYDLLLKQYNSIIAQLKNK